MTLFTSLVHLMLSLSISYPDLINDSSERCPPCMVCQKQTSSKLLKKEKGFLFWWCGKHFRRGEICHLCGGLHVFFNLAPLHKFWRWRSSVVAFLLYSFVFNCYYSGSLFSLQSCKDIACSNYQVKYCCCNAKPSCPDNNIMKL